jgi:hypothetical protein
MQFCVAFFIAETLNLLLAFLSQTIVLNDFDDFPENFH